MTKFMFMLCFTYILFSFLVIAEQDLPKSNLETYIIHVNLPKGTYHRSFLQKVTSDEAGSTRLVHSYRHVASGFAAKLSPEEVKELEKIDGFVSATPQKKFSLHTTHRANFSWLYQNLEAWNRTNYGETVIIGVVDTGITPGHLSFDDTDMPPPPAKWKGKCEFAGAACNNKLIGAQNFVYNEGHGTHTSSTAAGNIVAGVNVFSTAVGMAPRAHIAMYKVCADFCAETDILAAMDAAIDDGVDILALSLGGGSADYYADGIGVGAFAAIQKGIFVSASAGNKARYNGESLFQSTDLFAVLSFSNTS